MPTTAPTKFHIGPFGNPNAARADFVDDFLDIDGVLPAPEHDVNAMQKRIIVGRKGSGKTLYLRSHQDAARRRSFIVYNQDIQLSTQIVLAIDRNAKSELESIKRFSSTNYLNESSFLSNYWRNVWEKAVYMSVFSILSNRISSGKAEQARLSRDYQSLTSTTFEELVSDLTLVYSPASCLKLISDRLEVPQGKPRYRQSFLDNAKWEPFKNHLSALCREFPDVALYVDAVDEEFETAPEPWLHCQAGLFKATSAILNRSNPFSNRIHFVVSIRDIIFASLLRTEHATKFIGDEHIGHLTWNKVSTRLFLQEKIARLDARYLFGPAKLGERSPFSRWVGFDELANPSRKIRERVSDYLLRHTRMLPRDVVVIGNAVCSQMERRRLDGKSFSEGSLRQVTAEIARSFADESIEICMNEMLMSIQYFADLAAEVRSLKKVRSATVQVDVETEVIIEEIKRVTERRIEAFFHSVKREVFEFSDIKRALIDSRLAVADDFSDQVAFYRFDNILWRQGLLAMKVREGNNFRWRYNWKGMLENPFIDQEAAGFGFHSILIEKYKLEVANADPVF